ncbi:MULTISPECIES: magnesium transporter [Myroides]|uniref:Magnesium transporter MgtE n=1 Tax=Myroides odoratimimus TaxID=76832 RepID=A0AAI8C494_9FLAO|nr:MULTISPECIES: magnesium transporter [Myroides]AJA68444.1 magnesium transport protein MgtE [Myroides sp. A21]ALU25725.1 magnesium transporter [Myroides odoratimimus]EHO15004.1 magnesium transporter [Myroides odoratimimus CCUG 12901]MCA4791427.1 magnesium transporter [Myroides odoratimimus]MCA4818687.1 magnesium transporter [Myroides odoratimimus]
MRMHNRDLKNLQKIATDMNSMEKITMMLPVIKKMPIIDISELLSRVANDDLVLVFNEFTIAEQGEIFAEFPLVKQLGFFQRVSKKLFARIFEEMPSDARADLFQLMTQQEQVDLLPYLTKNIRENVLALSSYPAHTAGGIMITDFATVSKDMTCFEAIQQVRKDSPSKKTIYYVYVVNEDKTLVGFITLKDLIIAEPDVLVKDELHTEFVFGFLSDSSESIAKKIDKYQLVALPILNDKKQLVGIVTHDEALDVIQAEHTEDMERFMGIIGTNEESDYNQTSIFNHFKKRVFWLVTLAVIGIGAGMIIYSYEATLMQLMILALYMPMIASTGGNAGSQSATVVIRSLALGQITVKSWLKVLWKELRIALMLSCFLGLVAFGIVVFLNWGTEIPTGYTLASIGGVIALALSLQVITSTIIGALLPMLVRRFNGDPAVAASPAITTIVDISGLLIYFSIAAHFFNLK